MKRLGRSSATLVSKASLLLTFLAIAGCTRSTGSFVDPKGPIADAQLSHLIEVTALTMVAVLPVVLLVPWILWRYRYRKAADDYAPDWDQSRKLDLVMWGVPFAIIAILGGLLWRSTIMLDPYRPIPPAGEATRVEVVGLDWKWLFIYPDEGIATVGELAFPAERPLALELTTDTVMQSFMIGALGGQIYAMPGMRTKLHLKANGPGEYLGENMQYSGEGFHTQKFRTRAMSGDNFKIWLENARAAAQPLDAATYSTLAKRTTKEEVRKQFPAAVTAEGAVVFRLTTPGLFETILDRYRGAGPVTPSKQPGSVVYDEKRAAGGKP